MIPFIELRIVDCQLFYHDNCMHPFTNCISSIYQRRVTSSSEEVGSNGKSAAAKGVALSIADVRMATQESKSSLVAPILMATPTKMLHQPFMIIALHKRYSQPWSISSLPSPMM